MTFPSINHADKTLRNSVFQSKHPHSNPAQYFLSYVGYLIIRQFATWVISLPIFTKHILHIIGIRPKKQMPCINALRVIARMANAHLLRYRPVFKFPRNTMRQIGFSSVFKLPVFPPRLPCVLNAPVTHRFLSKSKTLLHGLMKWGYISECRCHTQTGAISFSFDVSWRMRVFESIRTTLAGKDRGCHAWNITHIHGGFNGYADRLAYYERAKEALS